MKLTVTITLAALATFTSSGAVLADEHSHYKALYELKQTAHRFPPGCVARRT